MTLHDGKDIMIELTNEFVNSFPNKESCMGITAKMIAKLGVPNGVIEDDPRVIQIVQWCRENDCINIGGIIED